MTILSLSLALALPAAAFEYWPGANYDPAIPTVEKVLGHKPGERIPWHGGIVKYFEALAAASPRLRVVEYARSWEGRKLIYAVVASEANMKRIDEVKGAMQRLADPRRTPPAEAERLMANLPVVVNLSYGVHGNEISSPDAAMLTAYHLLASRGDKVVDAIFANAIVLIDPLQNPDGRDRFVHHFEMAEGLEPDASQAAAEHNEPWPGGRTNHYLFDLNRDWFAATQPETQGRIQYLRQWLPLVFIDLHEMGSDSTYYFAPEAVPYNPHLTAEQRSSLDWFGRNNAKWFDRFGFDYFTREVFDAFYPGYGASWPAYYGAMAMTYEQASARGLVVRRSDETIMHFRDTVRRHFVASISTLETAAARRSELLKQFYRYQQTAIEEGSTEAVREYILPRRGDTAAVDKLAAILAEQGVEVRRARAAFENGGRSYPAGSYAISLAQPAKRLIRNLLDADVKMDEAFVAEQERRRKKKLPDEIYDVTAWSLPLLFNVECVAAGSVSQGSFEVVKPPRIPAGTVTGAPAQVAYLVAWGNAAAGRFLTAALRAGLRLLSSDKPFTLSGVNYPAGTLIVKVLDNPGDVHATVARLAKETGAEVTGVNTSWVDDGVNFGSRYVVHVRKPDVALAWDTGTRAYAAGATRFVLERQYNYPVTPIRTQTLNQTDLSRFEVVVLPDGSASGYGQVFTAAGIDRLKDWVRLGGTLVAAGPGAAAFLASQRVGLLSSEVENTPASEPPKKKEPVEGAKPGKLLASEEDYQKAIQPEAEPPDAVAGVLVRAKADADHWMAAGVPATVQAMVTGSTIFSPLKLDKGANPVVFAGPEELRASGYLWEENRKQLAFKPLVMVETVGRGQVIAFTADPTFRAYTDGLNTLFLNAIFRGPAHARPQPTQQQEEQYASR